MCVEGTDENMDFAFLMHVKFAWFLFIFVLAHSYFIIIPLCIGNEYVSRSIRLFFFAFSPPFRFDHLIIVCLDVVIVNDTYSDKWKITKLKRMKKTTDEWSVENEHRIQINSWAIWFWLVIFEKLLSLGKNSKKMFQMRTFYNMAWALGWEWINELHSITEIGCFRCTLLGRNQSSLYWPLVRGRKNPERTPFDGGKNTHF